MSCSAFERALDRHSSHPVLEPTYNPALLQRAPSLAADISCLLQVPESSWKTHRIHSDLMANTPAALTEYVTRIQDLANSADPAPLLAHSYVRYLGDLSGGQTIRHTLAKAYALEDGKGLSFYSFKELHSSKTASLGEMKRIKDWFRGGMDAGAGDNQAVKGNVAASAVHSQLDIIPIFYRNCLRRSQDCIRAQQWNIFFYTACREETGLHGSFDCC